MDYRWCKPAVSMCYAMFDFVGERVVFCDNERMLGGEWKGAKGLGREWYDFALKAADSEANFAMT